MKLQTVILPVFLSFFLCALSSAAFSSREMERSLSQRISEADVVVVGELKDIEENYFSIKIKHDEYPTIFDIGKIYISQSLAGKTLNEQLSGNMPNSVEIMFHHPNQTKNPFSHNNKSFQNGQKGIWILKGRASFIGSYIVDSFLDIEMLPQLKEEIENQSKIKPFIVSNTRPKDIPIAKGGSVEDSMTLQEILDLLGPGWVSPNEGVGIIKYFFDDGRILEVWPTTYEPSEIISLGQKGTGKMWWKKPE